jgi:F-type H+-transporting ATPase subunit b
MTMHIDWFVFFAQIVNFLILVYLLKRFLYGRIVKAMDDREAKIVQRFEDAEQAKIRAREQAEEYERKNRELSEMSDQMINQARAEVEAHKAELTAKARADVDIVQQRWIDTLAREQAAFLDELRRRAGQQIYAIARKALTDLADTDLEQKMLSAFLKRLEGIEEKEAKAIRETMGKDKAGIIIQSAFTVPPTAREKIREALARYMINNGPIQYATSNDIVSGIEMRTSGHKISWSLNDYLSSLEENFSQALQEASGGKN